MNKLSKFYESLELDDSIKLCLYFFAIVFAMLLMIVGMCLMLNGDIKL